MSVSVSEREPDPQLRLPREPAAAVQVRHHEEGVACRAAKAEIAAEDNIPMDNQPY